MTYRDFMKRILLLFLLILLIPISGILWLYLNLEKLAENEIHKALKNTNFQALSYKNIEIGTHKIILDSIQLDTSGLNTIKSVSVTYDPFDLFFKKTAQVVNIKGLSLTTLVSDEVISASIPDHASPKINTAFISQSLTSLPFETLILEDFTIDLGTFYGALRLEGKGEIRKTSDTYKARLVLWGEQKQLSFNMKAQAEIASNGDIQSKIELSEGRFASNDINISRTSGWVDLTTQLKNIFKYKYSGNVTIGGLKFQKYAFSNTSITLEGSNDNHIAIARSNPAGFNDILLTADIQKDTVAASLYSKKADDLYHWITEKETIPAYFEPLKDTLLSIRLNSIFDLLKQDNTPFSYTLSLNENLLSVAGEAIYNKKTNEITSKLDKTIIPLKALHSFFPFNPINGDLILDGVIRINNNEIKGPLRLSIKNGLFKYNDIIANNVNTWMIFDSLYPLVQKGFNDFEIESLNSNLLFQNINAKYHISKDWNILVKDLHTSFAGGNLKFDPFSIPRKKHEYTVVLEQIELANLLELTDVHDVILSGTISGNIPITYTADGVAFHDAVIKSDGNGLIQYTPTQYPSILSGSDHRINTLRLALQNFHYDSLELQATGPISKDMEAHLIAKGKSPLFGERPVHINLNLEGAIGPVIERSLQNFGVGVNMPSSLQETE